MQEVTKEYETPSHPGIEKLEASRSVCPSTPPIHDLGELLMVALCAILSGASDWLEIKNWGEAKRDWLRRYLPLANGIPSDDTFKHVFAALGSRRFRSNFIAWVGNLCPALTNQAEAEAIDDDKTSCDVRWDGARAFLHLKPAHVEHEPDAGLSEASASERFDHVISMVLGPVRERVGAHGVAAMFGLLDALKLNGAVVVIDEMGCQIKIAQRIIDGGADYALAVGEDQSELYERMSHMLNIIDANQYRYRQYVRISQHTEAGEDVRDRQHRAKTRRYLAVDIVPNPPFSVDAVLERWPSLRSVVMVESQSAGHGQASGARRQYQYYLSSLPADAQCIARAMQSRWSLSPLHGVMDVIFNENLFLLQAKNAEQNFALIRRISAGLIARDASSRVNVRHRRLKAHASDDYRAKVLGLDSPQRDG